MAIYLEKYKDINICIASNGKLYGKKNMSGREMVSAYLYDDLSDIRTAIDNETIEWK